MSAIGFTKIPLGTLQPVKVRDVWPLEDQNFTPWLAQEGLPQLGDKIGMKLDLVAYEHPVGKFKLDILAAEINEEGQRVGLVVIENQFGTTDHSHLGQLITYASGVLDEQGESAKTVVWIAEQFADEHRQALEWLNDKAASEVRYFGIELQLFRIDTSAPAPIFDLVVSPNEIARVRKADSEEKALPTPTRLLYVEYWTAFKKYTTDNNADFRVQTPRQDYWTQASIGRAGFHIAFIASARDQYLACELSYGGPHAKEVFAALKNEEAAITAEFGEPLIIENPSERFVRAAVRRDGNIVDRNNWTDTQSWLLDKGQKMFRTFKPRVRTLPIGE